MKILTFNTFSNDPNQDELTIFFQFTDEDYNTFLNWKEETEFDNIYEVFDYCIDKSTDYWNVDLFCNNDEFGLDFSAYEITTQKTIYFFD